MKVKKEQGWIQISNFEFHFFNIEKNNPPIAIP
jgi:hypothetical protein